jgi:undecaprenyl-diphosphatase
MLVVGTVVAFGAGIAAIAGLLKFLRTHSTLIFVVYRVLVGVILIALLAAGILHPHSATEAAASGQRAPSAAPPLTG